MEFLHLFLLFSLIITSIFVLLAANPVHSVLFLILAFCNAASILIILNVDFLGLLFIIIYVGAIAVLFLFVVMMLNVKLYASQAFAYNLLPIIVIVGLIVLTQLVMSLTKIFFYNNSFSLINLITFFDNLANIDVFGQVLYNYYLLGFLLAGLILLVAMIGAIVLTLNFKSFRKNEIAFRQLSRSDRFLTFF